MAALDAVSRGDAARRVLDEQVVKEALAGMKAEIIRQWSETPARDAEAREWVWRHYKVCEKFEAVLKGYIESGRMAKIEQDRKESMADRVKGRLARFVA